MKYLWQEYDPARKYYIDRAPLSPYWEVSYRGRTSTGINPLARFHRIFSPLCRSLEDDRRRRPIENCLLHYLARLDLISGTHRVSLLESRLDRALLDGEYGSSAQKIYCELSTEERRSIVVQLQRYESDEGRRSRFFDVVNGFFPNTEAYYYESERKFLVCLSVEGSERNRRLMELIRILFLDLGAGLECFWNRRFGIIGEARTMRIDRLVIY